MKSRRDQTKSAAPMPAAPAGFADEIDGFLSYVELEKGLSRNTAKSYESDLKQAAHFLRKSASGFRTVDAKQLSAWLHWLSDEGFTESSQARKLSAVRMLCRHLVRENERADDPTELL
ncbi:MAG TPA: site-specific integrase, partial [Candidatus Didemnitutus sp.]|nr:site-specific integrase [Candidatus Didemnitutus sp.]